MNFTFETQGNMTCLVYQVGENDVLDTMSLGMLTNNPIPALAEVIFTQMDTSQYIKYNVTSKISAAQLFSGTVNRKRLLGVFNGILKALTAAEDYMLEQNSILLDLNYIFTDVTTCETELVCLPLLNMPHKNPELGQFFKSIMFNAQFDQLENCDHVSRIISFLNSNPVLSVEDFAQMLKSMENPVATVSSAAQYSAKQEPVKPQPQVAVASQPVQQPVQQVVQQPVQQPVQQVVQQPVQQSIPNYPPQVPVNRQPVANNAVPPVQPAKPPVNPDEKPMSMFYLLQHYSKENAAKYKQQQEAKKAQEAAADAVKKDKKKDNKKDNKKKDSKKDPAPAGVSFAVPNQNNAQQMSFAVPNRTPVMEQPKQAPVVQQAPQYQAPQYQAPQYQAPQYQAPQYQANPIQPVQKPPAVSEQISFGETTVLGASALGETTVLTNVPDVTRPAPHLIRMKNNEKIPVNKPAFRIGKERSYVDYFIGDNTAISRSHANIICQDGAYYIMDTNSTNHTYVNGEIIPSNQNVLLEHGTKFRLANEEFEFRVY